MNAFKDQIQELLEKAGVKEKVELTTPPNPEMGDLAFACFGVAKEWKMSPIEAAKQVKSKLEIGNWKLEIAERIEAVGPYVNFYFNTSEIAKIILSDIQKQGEKYGDQNIGNGKKVMIEYPSENTHKEFHIGHLRNVCIGNTLVKLYNKCGYKMIAVNCINDFGAHVAKCLWYIEKNQKSKIKNQKLINNKQKWLGEMYAEASKYLSGHEELKSELDQYLVKLEKKDKEIWKLFLETRKWSLDGFKKIDKELGIKYSKIFLESQVKEKGQKIVDELLKKGVAQVGGGGAVIVDLRQYGLDIALIRKSGGAGVYFTSDFALAVEKFKKIKVDESINITGTEQNFYFKQLFKILELYGFKNKLVHIGYGLVNTPEGKMSSRSGRVILYEDLRKEVFSRLTEESKKRHQDWSDSRINKTANILTSAVLKFTMQKHEAEKIITFNLQEELSFEGFSAPYVLYVVARINSLLRKSKIKKFKADYSLLTENEEKKLLLLMGQYGEVVNKALVNYNPSVIAKYVFDLAQAFNEFYNKLQVLVEGDKGLTIARLALSDAVRQVLKNALGILTIETVEEM